MLSRRGALSAWLPPEGQPASASPLLAHMEEALVALREGGELVLPSMRLAEQERRIAISIVWDPASEAFTVVTTRDHGGEQTDRLLLSERREKLLLQQQAEAAAARTRVADALYRELVESAGDLVLRFGGDGRILFANRRAAEFLGVAGAGLVGRVVSAAFPPFAGRDPWRIEAFVEKPASFELATLGGDGGMRWLQWDVRFSGAEAVGAFQAVGRDVTEAKRLEAERDKAQEEARAAALAHQRLAIAHDLHDTLARSIVTMILEIGVIAKRTQDDGARAALRALQETARAGLTETREAIARLRAAPQSEDLRGVVDAFRARAAARGIKVDVHLDAAPLPAGLAETFGRVLREALRNVELHAGARRVEIALERENSRISLTISDDGAGFDSERPTPGHFGLVGMRERAALAGATLAIESVPGRGTRLTLLATTP